MKKMFTFLAVSLLFLSTAHADVKNESGCCTKSAPTSCFLNCECTQNFLKGFVAGAAAGFSAELLKPYFMQLTDGLNLHTNYGVCRGELVGQATTAGAVVGLSAFNNLSLSKTSAQLAGVIVGACTVNYVKKAFTTPAATSAQ